MAYDPIDREVLGRLDFGDPPGEVLRMLVGSFLEHSPKTAAALAEAGRQGDAEGVERSAHALKSSARQFGALKLGELCEALEAAGLENWRVGLGDASLYPALLDALGVPAAARAAILHELVTRDFVGLEREVEGLGLGGEARELLLGVPQLRGGPDVLAVPDGPAAEAVAGMRAVLEGLAPEVSGRVIFDLGLSRPLGYYTGAIFEVYDAALGAPLGGGGRYDDLLGRFGRELPAVGWAVNVERLHLARVGEGRRGEAAPLGGRSWD